MSVSDVLEVAKVCKKLRYEYDVSDKQFKANPCKKLNCFKIHKQDSRYFSGGRNA